eukprot:gene9682-1894_t
MLSDMFTTTIEETIFDLYYCDYCDTYLTHDSPSVRKTHNTGRKHKDAVMHYYKTWLEEARPAELEQCPGIPAAPTPAGGPPLISAGADGLLGRPGEALRGRPPPLSDLASALPTGSLNPTPQPPQQPFSSRQPHDREGKHGMGPPSHHLPSPHSHNRPTPPHQMRPPPHHHHSQMPPPHHQRHHLHHQHRMPGPPQMPPHLARGSDDNNPRNHLNRRHEPSHLQQHHGPFGGQLPPPMPPGSSPSNSSPSGFGSSGVHDPYGPPPMPPPGRPGGPPLQFSQHHRG